LRDHDGRESPVVRDADDIEEERRLLYVAMTRAKDQLALIVPHRFYVHNQGRGGDKHLYASRSRFIPSAIVSQFEVCGWPTAGQLSSVGRTSSGVTVDLAARMRDRWRATGT
jgi:DNA helicase II / ATP-dependent DNA helicase PcrA